MCGICLCVTIDIASAPSRPMLRPTLSSGGRLSDSSEY